jgi:hypothetical protein
MGTKTWARVSRLASLAVGMSVAVGITGLSLELFGQGKRVKVVYDERDGKKWVRSVEAAN